MTNPSQRADFSPARNVSWLSQQDSVRYSRRKRVARFCISRRIDLKFLGYFISTISVVLLAVVAWPGPGEPQWHAWVVAGGSIASILGMGVRWMSHRQNKKDIDRASKDMPPMHG